MVSVPIRVSNRYRYKVFVLVIFIVILSLSISITFSSTNNNIVPRVRWVSVSNPSSGIDTAISICLGDGYLYVVGSENSDKDSRFRIEVRSRDSGGIVKVWVDNPTPQPDYLNDCVVVGGKLYVVGVENVNGIDTEEILLVFDKDLNLLKKISWNPSQYLDEAKSIVSDGEYIYVLSSSILYDESVGVIRVRKFNVKNLGIAKVFEKRSSKGSAYIPIYIALNPSTEHLWVVGSIATFTIVGEHTYIFYNASFLMILDKDLNIVREYIDRYIAAYHSVSFDEEGNAYAVGWNGIAKYDKYGNLVAYAGCNACYKSLYLNTFLYITRMDMHQENRTVYQVLSVYTKNLTLVYELILNKNYTQSIFDYLGKIATDGENIYIAGYTVDIDKDEGIWTIYSIEISPQKKEEIKQSYQLLTIAIIIAAVILVITIALLVKHRKLIHRKGMKKLRGRT